MIGYAFYVCYSARIVCLLFSHGVTLSVLSHHTICTRFCEHIKLSAKSKVFSVCSILLSLFSPWKGLGHSLSLSFSLSGLAKSFHFRSSLLSSPWNRLRPSLSLILWTGQSLSVLFHSTLLFLERT